MSQFNFFRIEYRSGKQAVRLDASSCRGQDIPVNVNDPRLTERQFQLVIDSWIQHNPVRKNVQISPIFFLVNKDIPQGDQIFEDQELQTLWNQGVQEDKSMFLELCKSIWQGKRLFPSQLNQKISHSEFSLEARGALCFRNRLWISYLEPLHTALIQRTHDSHISGHPRQDNIAILSRSYFWPGMSSMVRRFCINCDVCGRSHVWRYKGQGLLLPLPISERFHSEFSIDFMTELPAMGPKDPRFLIVITDLLLCWNMRQFPII